VTGNINGVGSGEEVKTKKAPIVSVMLTKRKAKNRARRISFANEGWEVEGLGLVVIGEDPGKR
jgi:hypothetical protein